jgi:hypothetical protein
MSVVVEALTLIVRRAALDASYPGGADGYLAEIAQPSYKARWICGDRHLTAVSFLTDDLVRALELVSERGLDFDDDAACRDVVVVDELTGPRPAWDWIGWSRGPDLVTTAWLADEDPGDLVTPTDWAPARLARADIRDEDFMFKLTEEDGVETWLDVNTSQVRHFPSDPAGNVVGPIMKAMRTAVENRGWAYTMHGPRVARALFNAGVLQHELEIKVQEDARLVRCRGLLPFFAPEQDRAAGSSLTRAIAVLNKGESYEACQLDPNTGRIWVLFTVEISDGVINPRLAGEIIGEVEALCMKAHRPLLEEAAQWLDPVERAVRQELRGILGTES